MPKEELFVRMALDAWKIHIDRTTKLIESLSDDQLKRQVAPGRNTGTYLVGHLTAIHDALFTLMRFGERLFPELDERFVANPDNLENSEPLPELRKMWKQVNEKLTKHFEALPAGAWFERHAAISESDFEKEPHRNRLNVVLNRTNHLANHLGQLTFLKPRA